MTIYSRNARVTLGRFSQESPSSTCQNEIWNIIESLRKGYEVKCRDPRCSYSCNANWSYKHHTCVAKLLNDYVDGDFKVYRGHLRMPEDAVPDDHRTARKEFLRILNRWKTRDNFVLEMHAVLHIENANSAHWDVVAYSDAPRRPIRKVVSEAWKRVGGSRQSLVPVENDELVATLKYQVKDTVRVDRAKRHLPASRNDVGMNHVWSTTGFWAVKNEAEVWEELKKEWFGPAQEPSSCPILDMKSRANFRENLLSRLKTLTSDVDDYLKEFPWYKSVA